jgi:hypothetical protein
MVGHVGGEMRCSLGVRACPYLLGTFVMLNREDKLPMITLATPPSFFVSLNKPFALEHLFNVVGNYSF